MTEVTNAQLIELRDSDNLTPGEVYLITDYNDGTFKIYMTADSEKTFLDESTTDDPNISIHYDLDQAKIDYMKDTVNRIEGYFDWTSNVEGVCSEIYFENAALLFVKDGTNIVCENTVGTGSTVTNSSNITIGDGATVEIESGSNIIVGGGSTAIINNSTNVTVGERNNVSLTSKTAVAVADDNENITFDNFNKIGSRNSNITIEGESNVIRSDSSNLNIEGDLNDVVESRFIELEGSFNDVEKTSLTGLTNAVGNSVVNSSSVDIVNVNNNVVATRDIIIQNKPAFISYTSPHNSPVKIVRNLIEPVNMQSDCQARTLVVDQQKFYQESGSSGTKGNTKYVLENGIWTAVNY
jgi:hypothetical protein